MTKGEATRMSPLSRRTSMCALVVRVVPRGHSSATDGPASSSRAVDVPAAGAEAMLVGAPGEVVDEMATAAARLVACGAFEADVMIGATAALAAAAAEHGASITTTTTTTTSEDWEEEEEGRR